MRLNENHGEAAGPSGWHSHPPSPTRPSTTPHPQASTVLHFAGGRKLGPDEQASCEATDVIATLEHAAFTRRLSEDAGGYVNLDYPPPLATPPEPATPPPPPPDSPPKSCEPTDLLGELQASLRMPSASGSVLSAALALQSTAISASESEAPMAAGILHAASYSSLYTPAPLGTTQLTASLQGVEYAASDISVPLAPPVAVRGVLRTSEAYVDRSVVLAAFELRDAAGNSQVSSSGVSVTLTASRGGNSQTAECELTGLSMPERHYLGYCKLPSLPSGWFIAAGTATASLTLSVDGQQVASQALGGSIVLQQQPAWYGTLASQFSAATTYAVLPASPVYALESFDLPIYVHTGGYAVSTFWVWLTLDLGVVEYVSFSQSALYQTGAHTPTAKQRIAHGNRPAPITSSACI